MHRQFEDGADLLAVIRGIALLVLAALLAWAVAALLLLPEEVIYQ